MSFLVAYSDTPAGRDALALGVRAAHAADTTLDIVVVRHAENATPPQDGFTRYLEATIDTWLAKAGDKARATLGDDHVRVHQRLAESTAQGLFDAASDLGSEVIFVGGAKDGLRGRLALSSLASVLVHASPVAVALAPRKSRKLHLAGISRISVGIEPGHLGPVARHALALAQQCGAPLRLVSLAIPDAGEPTNHSAPGVLDGVTVDHVSATGSSVAEALASVQWQAEELLVLGSSRMAAQGRLFLGTTGGRA